MELMENSENSPEDPQVSTYPRLSSTNVDSVRIRGVGEKRNHSPGKVINWPFPQSLLSDREGFGNSAGVGGV